MFCVLSDDPETGVDNCVDHLVLLFALGRLPPLPGLVGGVHPGLFLVFVLQQQDGVVKGLLALGRLASIPKRDSQLGEGGLLVLFLSWLLHLGQLASSACFGIGRGGVFLLLLGGGRHETIQSRVFKGDHLFLTLDWQLLLRFVTTMG